jgi:hypothetical protein
VTPLPKEGNADFNLTHPTLSTTILKSLPLCLCSMVAINCLTAGPEIHVQYSTDPTEYGAMLASIHSALVNTAQPERLRFHLTIPDWANAMDLCSRLLNGIRARRPEYLCPAVAVKSYIPEILSVRDCAAGTASIADRGPQTDDSCFCGSAQFHILRFNSASYQLPGSAAMAGHHK